MELAEERRPLLRRGGAPHHKHGLNASLGIVKIAFMPMTYVLSPHWVTICLFCTG